MSDTALPTTTENGQTATSLPEEPLPWPAMMAFLTAWLFPATTARRTQTVPLLHAYGIHVLATMATFVLVILLVAMDENGEPISVFTRDILREFERNWQEALLITSCIVLVIEGGLLLLALIVLPWGAGDERLRSSWAHALRHTWMHSTHALIAVLLVGVTTIASDRAWRDYYHSPSAPSLPSQPTSAFAFPACPAHPTTQQLADYQKAVDDSRKQAAEANRQYERARIAYEANRPFLVRYGDYCTAYTTLLTGLWAVWALFRAVGAPRPIAPTHRSPTCEFCGYSLVGTPSDSRCPECGEPVVASLGPDVRPGPLWERRAAFGKWLAWWDSEVQPILSPARFGRTVQVRSANNAHRLFLAGHLPVVFAITVIAVIVADSLRYDLSDRQDDYYMTRWGIAPTIGVFNIGFFLALTLLPAGLVGMFHAVSSKRNLLPATARIASYLAGYMTFWTGCSAAWVVLTAALVRGEFFDQQQKRYGIDSVLLAVLFWGTPTLLGFLVYVVLLWKATAATRYANK